MSALIDVLGVIFISCLLIIFALLAAPYLYLHAMRAFEWYGPPGIVLFVAGLLVILVSIITIYMIFKKIKE